MSEYGTQVTVARMRAGLPSAASELERVMDRLARVPDPELPMVSIVDLGMVERVAVDDASITVEVLPTFLGCPALDLIASSIRDGLADMDRPITVTWRHRPPWTPDRITRAGLAALATFGIAGPTDAASSVRCPWCGSDRTVMDSAFGPTQCRSLHYCRACRQPFEALRLV